MDAMDALASAARFGMGLSQRARLLTLASAQSRALPESLMVEQFTGSEAVNALFTFDVDAVSVSTDLDLALFIGEELTIGLLQPDGSERAWHGICTEAAWLGADGGMARYRLHLEPALALLGLRRDSYIFQDKHALDIVTELLADYPQLRFELDVTETPPLRAICTQYRESDLAFFTRLLASEGLSWRFEHDQPGAGEGAVGAGASDRASGGSAGAASANADADGADGGDGQARHRLVIFDSQAKAPATPGGSAIRFHGVRATDSDDAIDAFGAHRQVQANAVSISSWDPAQLRAPSAEQQSSLDAGAVPTMPLYDGSGERIASDSKVADAHSRLMLQALEMDNKQFDGAGAARRLSAGHAITLTQHERYPDGENDFTILSVYHEGRNNIAPAIADAARAVVDNGTYRNRFTCVRDTVAIVPRATAHAHASTAPGPQTAIVVGLADAVSTTMRDHQVRIQFAWQRGARANAGGAPHNTDAKGNAPGDATTGTWVRVAEALAGPNWGTQFTPRIGTEVLVDFIEGDMDRPIVVGQLYTGADAPPFAAGADSGVNHAGVLSGIHSHNFDNSGFNQWQLDDTPGQVRTRLATSGAATQLNLGYLIAQAPATAHRGAYRGSGFELRTDAWAMLRGGEGVLLSTSARNREGSGVASTQMDAADAVARLKAAGKMSKSLFDVAIHQQALASAPAAQAQTDMVALLDPTAKGKHEGAVNGQQAVKASPGARTLDSAQPVEQFGAPLVLMDAAASINWATPASTVVFAGGQLHWTSGADLHLAAAFTVASVAANALNLFTHAGGIQAVAGNGPLSLQAHTGALEILADKAVTIVSVNDSIAIMAKEKIVLHAGQSTITLAGGDITFACPGEFSVKGGQHIFDGGASAPAQLPLLPEGALPLDTLYLDHRYHDDQPIAGAVYVVTLADGTERIGKLDAQGRAEIPNVTAGSAQVSFGPMAGAFERVDNTPMPNHDPAPSAATIDKLIDKYLKPEASPRSPATSPDKDTVA